MSSDRRSAITPGSVAQKDAESLSSASRAPDARRNALVADSPAGVDAMALNEVNTNASNNTRRDVISNLYRTLPDHSLKNSECHGWGLISPKTANDPISRLIKWKNEEYYITEVSTAYKIITVLNVLLLICVMVLSYRLWVNECVLVVQPQAGKQIDQKTMTSLSLFKSVINDWLSPSISFVVFVYSTYRVIKRTTSHCTPRQVAVEN